MPRVHFIPSQAAEYKLRLLTREERLWKLSELWEIHGSLELEVGLNEPLLLSCSDPIRFGLEPLSELAAWVATGRSGFFSRVMGTAALGTSNHLFHRWRGQFEAVLLLGERDSTIGLQKLEQEYYRLTVLETDDQPQLEDKRVVMTRAALLELPQMLWQDLDDLLRMLGVRLETKEAAKWERLRPQFEKR